MALSVTAPIGEALQSTKKILFRPFDAGKWFTLGFCAFLTQLGNCSGNSGSSWNPGDADLSEGGVERGVQEFQNWFAEHQSTILIIGFLVLLIVVAIWLTLTWLQSRGRFMFLDGVVHDRGAVVAPWKEYRREGNSLFLFAVPINLLGAFLSIGLMVIGLMLAWPDIEAGRFEDAAMSGLLVGGCGLLIVTITFALVQVFLNDFVVPAMYAHRVGVMEGWRIVSGKILGPHLGTIFLYVLMKILIGIASAVLTVAVVCATLCLAACILVIPYLGTVFLLPLFVFDRCYSIAFLKQLGDPWVLRAGGRELEDFE